MQAWGIISPKYSKGQMNLRSKALARQTSCRCPTLRFSPPSVIKQSKPFSPDPDLPLDATLEIEVTKCRRCAISTARQI